MTANKKVCGDCIHWEAGQCFRYPPISVPYPMDNQHPIMYLPQPYQPEVGAEHRACGEWQPF